MDNNILLKVAREVYPTREWAIHLEKVTHAGYQTRFDAGTAASLQRAYGGEFSLNSPEILLRVIEHYKIDITQTDIMKYAIQGRYEGTGKTLREAIEDLLIEMYND
jgi:hypothetical protein